MDMKIDIVHLGDKIGKEAMLEQTAEECSELSKACLKLARKLRDENPTHKSFDVLENNLKEEVTDVLICIAELKSLGLFTEEDIQKWDSHKVHTAFDRFRFKKG